MKIMLLAPKGFEVLEFGALFDVLGWADVDFGCDTKVVTCGLRRQVSSSFGMLLTVDTLVDQVNFDEYDALALPGGFEEFGYYEDAYANSFLDLVGAFHSMGKVIASVCVGALPLGKSGILKGKKATTYGTRRGELASFGVDVVNEPIVVDGNIITSSCPGTAVDVAFMLLEMLTDNNQTKAVRAAMGF